MSTSITTLKAAQDERNHAVEELRALAESIDGEPTAEQRATMATLNGVIDEKGAAIASGLALLEAEQRSDEFAAKLERHEPTPEPVEARSAFESWLRGETRTLAAPALEARDLLAGTATDGAELVPQSMGDLWRYVEDYANVASLCKVYRTSGGETLTIPNVTTNAAAAWEGESDAIAESDPQFASTSLGAFKLAALTQVSSELIADSAFDIVSEVLHSSSEKLALGIDTGVVTGSGTGQPTGFDNETAADTFASATAITANELIDVYHTLPAPFRANAKWFMKDSTVQYVRKLANAGTTDYVWQPGLALGQPDTLLGVPVVATPDMAAIATTNVTVAIGDLSRAMALRVAGGIRFERSDDFAFSTDLVSFRAIARVDAKVIDSRAIKVAKQL